MNNSVQKANTFLQLLTVYKHTKHDRQWDIWKEMEWLCYQQCLFTF